VTAGFLRRAVARILAWGGSKIRGRGQARPVATEIPGVEIVAPECRGGKRGINEYGKRKAESGRGILGEGAASQPPPHQLEGLGSAVSSPSGGR